MFTALTRAQATALLVCPGPLTFSDRGELMDFAAQHGLPAMCSARACVEAGGLMS
jgi:hypothetical protein